MIDDYRYICPLTGFPHFRMNPLTRHSSLVRTSLSLSINDIDVVNGCPVILAEASYLTHCSIEEVLFTTG